MIIFIIGAVFGSLITAIGGIVVVGGINLTEAIRNRLHTRRLRIDGRLPSGRVINVRLEGWRR